MHRLQIVKNLIILCCLTLSPQAQTEPSTFQANDEIVEQFCGGDSVASLYAVQALRTVNFLLVFKREAAGVKMYRIELREISGPEVEMLSRGPSVGCANTILKRANGISKLKLHGATAEKLLAKLREINLQSDTCPRDKRTGHCAMFFDGGGFEIRVGERSPIYLEDVSEFGDVISENKALLDWALKVLGTTDTPRGKRDSRR